MKKADTGLTEEQWARLEALGDLPDDQIDYSDIPPTTDWSSARRGRFQLPMGTASKQRVQPTATDTSEQGLETRIFNLLLESGWLPGDNQDYLPASCVDLAHLATFLQNTQPETAQALNLDADTNTRQRFLRRLHRETGSRGIIDVLRNGVDHGQHSVRLFYGTPSPGNQVAGELHTRNRFSVTRQVHYSTRNPNLCLDLVLFINGLPVLTFELKNNLTKQTVEDAIEQYKRDRDPREDLFRPGRCAAHMAVDENRVRFCAELEGQSSIFLPFDQGHDGGAGNPPNPQGLRTDYLWQETLTPEGLTDIIENYAQKIRNKPLWPRYHQLEVVRQILSDVSIHGAGNRYLIQHSAGSGKSNSIAWLARQLIGLQKDSQTVFDSTIIVTDRVVLDSQISETVKQFTQVSSTVGHAESSADLRQLITEGKRIIITTVQKFPFIAQAMAQEHLDRRFAIIIDEAHSSQGGRASAGMNAALGDQSEEEEDDYEDQINKIIESRKMLGNASYFAFTATPKNRTLELFGQPVPQPDGAVKHLPFHSYTMKQAIQEGFILDVLRNYTSIQSYFNLIKKIDEDPEFDSGRAQRRLRHYVEGHEYAIRAKSGIMVDHFKESVFGAQAMGGKARAMVVTDGVDRAIDYYLAISEHIKERGLPFRVIIAFSGERDHNGKHVSEASLNGFPSNKIPEMVQEDPYRILICADKFQTGYDEPLLNTMYVDKTLGGIRAVQTLSRLNRAAPNKDSVFVLDFMNNPDAIQAAFADYYQTTILANETDPDKLHDLRSTLDQRQVYSWEQIDTFVEAYLNGAGRDQLDPTLDVCTEEYLKLDEDGQVEFKSSAKAFGRLYAFLSQVLPYGNANWEKLSIFLNFLVNRLPAPEDEDLSQGILEAVDMDTYRMERKAAQTISLAEEDAEIDPVLASAAGGTQEPEMDRLSNIVAEFNKLWGGVFTEPERVTEIINRMPEQVLEDEPYRNARLNSDRENAQIEHDSAVRRLITAMVRCQTELYKAYTGNVEFREWLNLHMFSATYTEPE